MLAVFNGVVVSLGWAGGRFEVDRATRDGCLVRGGVALLVVFVLGGLLDISSLGTSLSDPPPSLSLSLSCFSSSSSSTSAILRRAFRVFLFFF